MTGHDDVFFFVFGTFPLKNGDNRSNSFSLDASLQEKTLVSVFSFELFENDSLYC